MTLEVIHKEFAICKIADVSLVDFTEEFLFIGKTEEELSLVCGVEVVPENYLECDWGWRGFRIAGVLEFSMVGILAKLSAVLAESKVGIFAVSTFNTDYIFVKKENLTIALEALRKAGYVVSEGKLPKVINKE